MSQGATQELDNEDEGPFSIEKRVENVAYRVQLSPTVKYYLVFHVSMLKPYHKNTEDPNRGKSSRSPAGIRMEFDKEAEKIIGDRTVREANNHPRLEYFVKWKGLPDSESRWEPARAL